MTIHAISSYLLQFDAPTPSISLHAGAALLDTDADALADQTPPFTVAAETSAQWEEMRSALQSEFAAAREMERVVAEERLRAERDNWSKLEAAVLAERAAQAIADGLAKLRSDIVVILTPFVVEKMLQKFVDDMIGAIRTGLADGASPAIDLSGPRDLLDKIGVALAERGLAVTLRESDDIDARVAIGSTLIETRRAEWMARLRGKT